MFELILVMALATAAPTPAWTPPPPHVALDYAKPGQPHLTARQVARIRQVLAEVKPCQRPLVRYVLDVPGFIKDGVALFFYSPRKPEPTPQAPVTPDPTTHVIMRRLVGVPTMHVFDEPMLYYALGIGLWWPPELPESEQRAQANIQWDIAHQPCPPNSK